MCLYLTHPFWYLTTHTCIVGSIIFWGDTINGVSTAFSLRETHDERLYSCRITGSARLVLVFELSAEVFAVEAGDVGEGN